MTEGAHFFELFATMRSRVRLRRHFELALTLRVNDTHYTTDYGDDDGPSSTAVNASIIFLSRYLIHLYLSDFLTTAVAH